jgi:hypothetical protein
MSGSANVVVGRSAGGLVNRRGTRHAVLLDPLPSRAFRRESRGPRNLGHKPRIRWVVHVNNVPRGRVVLLVGCPNVKGAPWVIGSWLAAHLISPNATLRLRAVAWTLAGAKAPAVFRPVGVWPATRGHTRGGVIGVCVTPCVSSVCPACVHVDLRQLITGLRSAGRGGGLSDLPACGLQA